MIYTPPCSEVPGDIQCLPRSLPSANFELSSQGNVAKLKTKLNMEIIAPH